MIEINRLDQSLELLENKEEILLRLKNTQSEIRNEYLININYLKAKALRRKGELDKALDCAIKCFNYEIEQENNYILADPNNLLGIIYSSKGMAEEAEKYFNKSLDFYVNIGNKKETTKIHSNLGMVLREKGNFQEALKFFTESLESAFELNNKRLMAMCNYNIGLVYFDLIDFDNSLLYIDRSLKFYEDLGSKFEIALCYNHMGNIYESRVELELAQEYYNKSLFIFEKLGIKSEIATILNNLGNIYRIQGELRKASDYYLKSLEIFETLGSDVDTGELLLNLINNEVLANSIEKSFIYLNKLETLNEKNSKTHVNHFFKLGKALILKASHKLSDLVDAQRILQTLAQEETIRYEYKYIALIHLCDLLLIEIKAFGAEETLLEIENILSALTEIAEKNNHGQFIVETLILKSRMELIKVDISLVMEMLDKAEEEAQNRGMKKLAQKVSTEKKLLYSEIDKWQQLSKGKSTVIERLEEAKLQDYIKMASGIALGS
jgi:tetratricopeptide (TPR) repeat protein